MSDIGLLFQAFVAPAIFVSATALLILSVNVRLMGIVSRLRAFIRAKHEAERCGRLREAEACALQVASIEARVGIIRRCFLAALISLAGSTASCFLLGLGIYVRAAAVAAAAVFVFALASLLVAVVHYIHEVKVSLTSVEDEARDMRFAEFRAPPGKERVR
jgi:hypothetical protein